MIGIPEDLLIRVNLGRSGKYVEAGGVKTYYESYGEGPPLLLLHGGLSTLETFRYQVGALAKHYPVILPERSGHGHTADINSGYSYDQMAEETLLFMETLRTPADHGNLIPQARVLRKQRIRSADYV